MALFRALLYLRLTSLRNGLLGRLRRLRQPKYLVGAIAGALYFWFFFFRRRGPGGPSGAFAAIAGAGQVEYMAAIGMTLFLLIVWLVPGDTPGLAFTEAEVAFLFPAPLTRRQLIHYKLLDGLLMSLFGSVFFVLLTGGLRSGFLVSLRYLGAWWALNATFTLHQTAVALTLAKLNALGLRSRTRRLIIAGVGLLAVAALITSAVRFGPQSLSWLIWPARLYVRPFLATGLLQYLLALGPACAILLVHYFWVHQMESPFEEASIARAQKLGEHIARLRAGKGVRFGSKAKARRAPFRLGDRLPVEAAFVWKNLLAAPPYLNLRSFFVTAAIIVLGLHWLQGQTDYEGPKLATVAATMALVFLGYLVVFGPQLARNDLRSDLSNADLLKAYPLPGWRILLGSLLAPAVLLTAVGWLLLLAAATGASLPAERFAWFTPEARIAIAGASALVLPALCALQLLVPNAAALLFPAWAQMPRVGGGIDVMGQRMIFMAGQFLCLALALLPAIIAAGLTIFLTQWLIGLPASVVLAVVPVLMILLGEIWLGVALLGPRFENLDISAELRP